MELTGNLKLSVNWEQKTVKGFKTIKPFVSFLYLSDKYVSECGVKYLKLIVFISHHLQAKSQVRLQIHGKKKKKLII